MARPQGPTIAAARFITNPALTPPVALGRPLDRSRNGLLAEAFRLHRLAPKPAVVIKSDWPLDDASGLAIDLGELRLSLHDGLYGAMRRVTTLVTAHIGGVLAAVGHVAADVLTDERARASLHERIAAGSRAKRKPKPPPIPQLEALDGARAELRMLSDPAALESALRSSYGDSMVNPDSRSDVTSAAIPAETSPMSALLGQYESFLDGAIAWGMLGLSERLYHARTAAWFERIRPTAIGTALPGLAGPTGGGQELSLHVAARRNCREVLDGVLAGVVAPASPLSRVFASIDALEAFFAGPLAGDEPTRRAAVAVGLPWAIVLCALLRVFWTDMLARLAMLALPLERVRSELDPHLAAALFENLTGAGLPTPSAPGYTVDRARSPVANANDVAAIPPDATVGGAQLRREVRPPALTGWLPSKFGVHWQRCGDPVLDAVLDFVAVAESRPFVLRAALAAELLAAEQEDRSPQVDTSGVAITATELRRSWPRYPTMTRLPSIRFPYPDQVGLDLYYGSYYVWQTHLHVASAMTLIAVRELGLRHPALKLINRRLGSTPPDGQTPRHVRCPECAHIAEVQNKKYQVALPERCDAEDGPPDALAVAAGRELPPSDEALPTDDELRDDEALRARWLARRDDWRRRHRNPVGNAPDAHDGGIQALAGSYLWGGAMKPHKTHKDGSTFDLRFGADVQMWVMPEAFAAKFAEKILPRTWDEILGVLMKHDTVRQLPRYSGKLATRWDEYNRAIEQVAPMLRANCDRFGGSATALFPLDQATRRRLRKDLARAVRAEKRNSARGDEESKRYLAELARLRAPLRVTLDAGPWLQAATADALSSLLSVRLRGRDAQMAPRAGNQVFRGLVRDLVLRELARLKTLRATSPLAVTDEERSQAARSEQRLHGTPHNESARGRQESAIGHSALLLSGVRSIIYGSPITHLRAVLAIREALCPEGSTPAIGWALETMLPDADLEFMPHNHADHWHAEYRDPGRRAAGTREFDPVTNAESSLARLETSFLPFWFSLGIDLAPLLAYFDRDLGAMPTSGDDDPELARSAHERARLAEMLARYQQRFDGEYLADAEAFVRFVRARRRLHAVFRQFTASAPLLQATRPSGPESAEIRALKQATDEVLTHARSVALRRKIEQWTESDMIPRGLASIVELVGHDDMNAMDTELQWDILDLVPESPYDGD